MSARSASETNGFSRTYGYDRYGNRWVASGSGITAYEPHEPTSGSLFNTANNRLANQSDDAAGNQTSDDPRTMTDDAENRMIGATGSQNGTRYVVNFSVTKLAFRKCKFGTGMANRLNSGS